MLLVTFLSLQIVPVSSEVCFNRQAAIATVLVSLPCNDGLPAVGQSAVCFGSCLAPVSNQQSHNKSNGVKSCGNKRTGSSSR